MPESFKPTTFHRHNRPLRALLLESQIWFCARDIGRLIGWPLNERTMRKLDADQRRLVMLDDQHGLEEALMVSESGVYAMLVHHHHAENRGLRQWITNEVVTCLRDGSMAPQACSPCLSFLQWPGLSVSMLYWQSEPWIRLRDMPKVLAVDGDPGRLRRPSRARVSWWRMLVQVLRLS